MFGLLLYPYVGSTLKRGGEEGVEDVCVATFHDIAEHKTGGKKKKTVKMKVLCGLPFFCSSYNVSYVPTLIEH